MLHIQVEHDRLVNLIGVQDVHLAAVPPGRRRDTYMQEILGKLGFVSDLATKVRGQVLCAGDLFHSKRPQSRSNTPTLIRATMDLCQRMPHGTMFGNIGNHDITGDNLDTLDDQPLGILLQAGAYHDLSQEPVCFHTADRSVQVVVYGFDYGDGTAILERMKAVPAPEPGTHHVAVVHAFGTEGSSAPIYGEMAIGYQDIAEQTSFSLVFWGHDHSRKAFHQVGPCWQVQLGSLARAALSYDEVERPISVAVASFGPEGLKVKEIAVPCQPLHLAFHTATLAVDQVETNAEVRGFLADLAAQAEAVESTDPITILKELTDDADMQSLILDACELG